MGGSASYRANKKVAKLSAQLRRSRSPQKRMQLERDLRAAQRKSKTISRDKAATKFYEGKRQTRAEKKTISRATKNGFNPRLRAAYESGRKRGIKL